MEKIKRALERAREEKLGSEPRKPEAPVTSATPDRVDDVDQSITYSKTRVVDIRDDLLRRNKIVVGNNFDPAAATAYKILRTQVEQRLAAKNWNTLAVTSPVAGQGKTLTAINLSVALAREMHRTVLLVDADLRNPSVHDRFGITTSKGLIDYLLDDVPITELLVNPGIEKLVVLPAGRQVPNSSELLSSPKMANLVDELKSRYPSRIIVFDLPPLLSSDDTLAFSPFVEAVLLVLEDGKTTRGELARTMEVLNGVHVLGTVLNRSSETQASYY